MAISVQTIKCDFLILKRIFGFLSLLFLCACGGSGGASKVNSTTEPIARGDRPYQKLEWVAGQLGDFGNADGLIGRFSFPIGVAVNADGLVYVNDELGQRLRTVNSRGLVTSLEQSVKWADGISLNYSFVPSGDGVIALDSAGNLYSVGSGGCHIRKMTLDRVTSIFAGQLGCGYIDGERSVAQFSTISSIVIDAYDNVYVADRGNYVIRKINMAGVVSTLAGKAGVAGSLDGLDQKRRSELATNMTTEGMVDGVGEEARFLWPLNLAVDRSGNVYVGDGYHVLRKVSFKGEVSRVVCKDDMGRDVLFFAGLSSMVTDDKGNLFITETNKIKKMTPDGLLTRFVGGDADGSKDGQGIEGRFRSYIVYGGQWMPGKLAIDKANFLYFADAANHAIRNVSPSGLVTTIAGRSVESPDNFGPRLRDGSGGVASLGYFPYSSDTGYGRVDMGTDELGNVYLLGNRKVAPNGDVSTLTFGDTWQQNGTFTGARTKDSTLFWIAQTMIFKTGSRSTLEPVYLAGTSRRSQHTPIDHSHDGVGVSAFFSSPIQLVVDSQKNVFVLDQGYCVGDVYYRTNCGGAIRKIDPNGVVTTIAGSFTEHGYENGAGLQARFNGATGLAIDNKDQLYVVDRLNHVIRKVSKDGTVSVFAGTPMFAGSRDGDALTASFNLPEHITIDSAGNVYVADNGNFLIRKITPSGVVSTIAGRLGSRGTLPGSLPANLSHIYGMTFDDQDTLYIASENSVLRLTK